jgi:NTP pyrophosphatase (non-canonical NTP hydrolase)
MVTAEATEPQTPAPRKVIEPSYVAKMGLGADADSKRWFKKTAQDPVFMTLCLLGEGGELANIVKKIARGSLDPKDATVRYDVQMEMADVFTYLLALSVLLGVDLEKAYYHKRALNEKRFGPKDD